MLLLSKRGLSSPRGAALQVSKGLSRVEETLLKMYDEDEADRRFQTLQTAARSHGLLEALSDDETDEETETVASPHLAEVAEPHTAEEVRALRPHRRRRLQPVFLAGPPHPPTHTRIVELAG